jgi:transcriptional regulator with XRE-family HTH domain
LRSELRDKEYAHAYADELLNAYIATQIKVLRQQRKWSQKQLAVEAGMAQERVSVLEDVNYSSWTVKTLLKLARAFDLRLRVSFESFSTVLSDMQRLSASTLERTSRIEDLGYSETSDETVGNEVILATYNWAKTRNAGAARQSALIGVRRQTLATESEPKESASDETTINKPGSRDMAVSALRSQSKREGIRSKWTH